MTVKEKEAGSFATDFYFLPCTNGNVLTNQLYHLPLLNRLVLGLYCLC